MRRVESRGDFHWEVAWMNASIHSFGIIGLGKMGGGLAANALEKGFEVAGVDTHSIPDELQRAGLKGAADLKALAALLPRPRFVMLYVPAGPPVDAVLEQLAVALEPGDIIADGGNSYWGDSIRRHARLKRQGIHFIDAGTSGGPAGAREGACFMVGGETQPVAMIEPLLCKLAVEGGYVHAGPPGAGHFVKLVHNGIEFGMLQAIGEGMELLAHFGAPLPIAKILQCWEHGSVIRSWLIELMEKMYREQGKLESVPPYVEDTGEVNWLVDDALHMEVPIPVITQAVVQLLASRDRQNEAARAVAMMRHGFGGHPFGADAGIARERHTGRVGGFIGSSDREAVP
jgi:6-phosphogluconate dehydrogenase